MNKPRAELLDSGDPHVIKARIVIDASAKTVFDLLASPKNHPLLDGSGTVKESTFGPDRLFLGAKFGMRMFLKIPYRISNTVIIFKENSEIGWHHFMRHIWRYELVALSQTQTEVTEYFDGNPALSQAWLNFMGAYKHHPYNILKSLVKLKLASEASTRAE